MLFELLEDEGFNITVLLVAVKRVVDVLID
jgi:hypothetical protein